MNQLYDCKRIQNNNTFNNNKINLINIINNDNWTARIFCNKIKFILFIFTITNFNFQCFVYIFFVINR